MACLVLLLPSAGDPDRGYQQLITEQMPIRKQQLYETYGPQGPIPLIPGGAPPAGPPCCEQCTMPQGE